MQSPFALYKPYDSRSALSTHCRLFIFPLSLMAAVANILSVLFLFLLSYPFCTKARNTHSFNSFTHPKGNDQPQFEQAHTPEREESVKAHIFLEIKYDTDSEDPTPSQNGVTGGSSSNDPTTIARAPDGSVIRTTETESSSWLDVNTPNGHMHQSEEERSRSVTVTRQYSNQQYYSSTTP